MFQQTRTTFAAAALFCGLAMAQSQSATGSPAFEAASIKPVTKPGGRLTMQGGPGTSDPGRIRYNNISLRYLVMAAYRVGSFQLSAPDWLDAKAFEIVATLPPGTTGAQLHQMLQTLLKERFHLSFHREQRVMPTYTLVVGKNGPKMKPSALEASAASADTAEDFDPVPPGPPNELELDSEGYPIVPPTEGSWLVALRSGRARSHQLNASMQDLASLLSSQLARPVKDATGLKGRFEFTLSWTAGVPARTAEEAPQAADAGPDLLAAVQQQLGLRLEASRGPVEVLVVDDLEKEPVGN